MAKKSNRKKTKSAAKPRPTKRAARPKTVSNQTACYVSVSPPAVSIVSARPKAGTAVGPCNGLEETKNATLDGLISLIEDAERKLIACKRARTIEQLRRL